MLQLVYVLFVIAERTEAGVIRANRALQKLNCSTEMQNAIATDISFCLL